MDAPPTPQSDPCGVIRGEQADFEGGMFVKGRELQMVYNPADGLSRA
jgi:hypothetical protein